MVAVVEPNRYRERLDSLDAYDLPDGPRVIAARAVKRFESLTGSPDPSTSDLVPIRLAAESHSTIVGEFGVSMLLELARRSGAALDAVLGLATHDRWQVRHRLQEGIDEETPVDLATELVRFTVHDPSTKVRVKSAERIAELGLDLAPELRESVARETDPAARANLEHHLAVACRGYFVVRGDGDQAQVWMRLDTGAWVAFDTTLEEIEAGAIPDRVDRERLLRENVR